MLLSCSHVSGLSADDLCASYFTDVRIKADAVEEDWKTATAVHLRGEGGAVSAEEWQKTMYKYISIQMKLKLAELEQFSL